MESNRREFTREFKVEAVKMVTEGGHSVAEVARDLNVGRNLLSRWKRQLTDEPEQSFPGKGRLRPLEDENRRLRRALQRAEQERDFLKKAALWLAQEAHRSTS